MIFLELLLHMQEEAVELLPHLALLEDPAAQAAVDQAVETIKNLNQYLVP
jgi:lactate dehydrogenase-like 2-hydroxyacid dehydrogenase